MQSTLRRFASAVVIFAATALSFAPMAPAQVPFSGAQSSIFPNYSFAAQTFTATNQTGTAIGMPGASYGVIQVKAATITTVTLAVQGSIDGGLTWTNLFIAPYSATPTAVATPLAITAAGLYVVNLAGITNVRFATSGTFTATGFSVKLNSTSNKGIL